MPTKVNKTVSETKQSDAENSSTSTLTPMGGRGEVLTQNDLEYYPAIPDGNPTEYSER